MGWLLLAAIGAAAFALLLLLGVPRTLRTTVMAALVLGAIGYALQGAPDVPDSPAQPAPPDMLDSDPALADLRDRMLGRFTGDWAYLAAADAMARVGERRAQVQVILGGIKAVPDSLMLWTALGTALAGHDGDQVSPPALFAFQQAMRLNPSHPAPPFFLGLAYVRAGQFAQARGWWRRALALCPPQASYCRDVAERLRLLDAALAQARP